MNGKAWPLGIRPSDLLILAVVIAVIEVNVAVGGGTGAAPLDALSWVIGAVIALPLLVCRRWPRAVLLITFAEMILFYLLHRRNISPAPLMFTPVYATAVAGYLAWSIAVPTVIMVAGLVAVGLGANERPVDLLAGFLPSIVIFILAVALGEVVRGRRALAAETSRRLALAAEEQRSEAARLLAEERLRIARELHDTVAHSMATITVQAGSALHVLSTRQDDPVREVLVTIRDTSKSALGEMRAVLGQLRDDTGDRDVTASADVTASPLGLDRLADLRAAVTAAGSPVTVTVEGDQQPLPPAVDHAAYRILQESLTNVLRHAAGGTPADVRLRYAPDALMITVANDGCAANGSAAGGGSPEAGNGIRGMRERAAAAGGELEAGPRPGGGFLVTATLPRGDA